MGTIALVIRGKHSTDHNPDLMQQHADVVLSDGSPMGFFGTGDGMSGASGMSMDGQVADYHVMKQIRPHYVDVRVAQAYNVVSTICLLRVPNEKAKKFDNFWRKPTKATQKDMQTFSILADNCSTMASEAFRAAGILKEEIPGLDTPNNLYHQLKMRYGADFSCVSGHVGFEKRNNKYFPVVIRK